MRESKARTARAAIAFIARCIAAWFFARETTGGVESEMADGTRGNKSGTTRRANRANVPMATPSTPSDGSTRPT